MYHLCDVMQNQVKNTVLLADDHPMITQGISSILKRDKRYQVVDTLDNGKAALDYILNNEPDIAILDVEMGVVTGLDIARKVQEAGLKTKIIILTMHRDKSLMLNAMDLDVLGYITKDLIQDDIIECLEKVSRGERYIVSGIFENKEEISTYVQNIKTIRADYTRLSKSEKNIIALINQNFTSVEIAERLFVSSKTVENHRGNICKKLQISGHNALVRWVKENHHLISTVGTLV